MHLRLGVNIDHVATIRNARGGEHPDPVRAAVMAEEAGADGITAHLREDRRHISDDDIFRLKNAVKLHLNLEMAATEEMLAIAIKARPNACCLVPEKRMEVTTEGGLNLANNTAYLRDFTARLRSAGIKVSLFIEPAKEQITLAHEIGADIVELHTGRYCEKGGHGRKSELMRIIEAARYAASQGLEVHAGHGLSFSTAGAVAAIPQVVELNIGHFLVGEAVFTGLSAAIKTMRTEMDRARMAG